MVVGCLRFGWFVRQALPSSLKAGTSGAAKRGNCLWVISRGAVGRVRVVCGWYVEYLWLGCMGVAGAAKPQAVSRCVWF